MCTASPPRSPSITSSSPVWRPARTCSPSDPMASATDAAHRIARAGPSNVARKPSPVRFTSRPRWRSSAWRNSASWRSRRNRHPRSPISAARRVESQMSVNSTVASIRSGSRSCRVPVRNSSISPITRLGVADGEHVVAALELHVAGARHLRRDVAGVLDLDEAVLCAVHHERRHADRGQHVAHVDLADQLEDAPDRRWAGGQALEPAGPLQERAGPPSGSVPRCRRPRPRPSDRSTAPGAGRASPPARPSRSRAPRWRARRSRTARARPSAPGTWPRTAPPSGRPRASRRSRRARSRPRPSRRARRPSAPRAWALRRSGSDRPEPRRSNVITRANWVSRAITRSSEGSDHRYSTCEIQGGTQTRSSGPSPSTA